MDNTTPAPQGDQTSAVEQDNPWLERYTGLQKVLSKRDTELASVVTERDSLKAEHEAAMAELSEHRSKVILAKADEDARQTYEQLRQRFEEPPPAPLGANPRSERPLRGWEDGSEVSFGDRERTGTSTGWPT